MDYNTIFLFNQNWEEKIASAIKFKNVVIDMEVKIKTIKYDVTFEVYMDS